MEPYQDVFKRYEKKYLISCEQKELLLRALDGFMEADAYGRSTITSIYFDTEDYRLIRSSLEKPLYKEKLRLRCYGTPGEGSTAFLELKKKCKDIVYKRRVSLTMGEGRQCLAGGVLPDREEQILSEIRWFLDYYKPIPKALIAYERTALYGTQDPGLRLTFDEDIRGRSTALTIKKGSWGTLLLPKDTLLAEVKLPGVMPLWMSRLFSRLDIFPVSYSKYGTYYQTCLSQAEGTKGERLYA